MYKKNEIKNNIIAIDTEATGLDICRDTVTHLSWAYRNKDDEICKGVTSDHSKMKEIAEDIGTVKIYQNAKYDYHVLNNTGIKPFGFHFDTQVGDFLVDENPWHNLDAIGRRWVGRGKKEKHQDIPRPDPDQISIFDEDMERDYEDYAIEDAALTFESFEKIKEALLGISWDGPLTMWDYYGKYERNFMHVLFDMERHGFPMDAEFLEGLVPYLDKQIQKNAREFLEWADKPIDLNSPSQLSNFLYDVKGFPIYNRTRTKAPSTNEKALELLIVNGYAVDPLNSLLNYKLNSKLLNTYVTPILEAMDSSNRVHTQFHQTAAVTGRLSCSDPPLHQIPSKKDIIALRTAFIAPPGWVVVRADYNQIELRIAGMLSGDHNMIGILSKGGDIHKETAILLSGGRWNSFDEDEKELQRKHAKTINFGVIYGMGAKTLAKTTGMSVKDAKQYLRNHNEAFPSIRETKEIMDEQLDSQGFLTTILGRRRNIKNPEEHYKGFNSVDQGTAADVMKLSMIEVYKDSKIKNLDYKPLLQVHDELVGICPLSARYELMRRKKELMENSFPHRGEIPFKVSINCGPSWGDCKG